MNKDMRTKYFYNKLNKLQKQDKYMQKLLQEIAFKNMESQMEIDNYKNMLKKNRESLTKFQNESKKEVNRLSQRLEKEQTTILMNDKRKFLIKFIDALSHFEYAMLNITDMSTLKGIEMVYNEFIKVFKEEGIEVIEKEGVPFDHTIHNAIGVDEKKGVKSGIVLKIIRKGFKLEEKLIRPADCIVSK